MTWTPEMHDRLAVLWPTGLSAAQCANQLNAEFGTNYTRNAVIGRIHRHLEPRKMHAHPRARDNSGHRKPKAGPTPVVREIRIAADPVPLLDRKPHQCPFILAPDDAPSFGPDFFVCGAKRAPGKSYCKGHMAITHHPAQIRKTRAEGFTGGPKQPARVTYSMIAKAWEEVA